MKRLLVTAAAVAAAFFFVAPPRAAVAQTTACTSDATKTCLNVQAPGGFTTTSSCYSSGLCTPLSPGQYGLAIATSTALTVPTGALYVTVQAVGQSLNYTTDGATTPTTTVGINLPAGASVTLGGATTISNFRAITTTAGGTLNAEFFK